MAALVAAGGVLAESTPPTTVSGGSGSDLRLEINGEGRTSIYSEIDYSLGAGQLSFRLAQPAACFDFGAQQQGVRLSMSDINDDSAGQDLYGLTGIDIDVGGGRLALTTSESLRCFVTDDTGTYILAPEGQSAGGGGELLFASGFEDPGFGVGDIDLRVEFLDLPPATLVAGHTISYAILVSNVGTETADDVAFQDAYPASTDLFDAVLSDGAWVCMPAGGADCGSLVSSLGPIRVQDLTLPPGASVEYQITGRALFDIPVPTPGTVMNLVAGAVAGDQADFDPTDNTAQTSITVITAPAALAVDPGSRDFGAVAVNGQDSRLLELSNSGDAGTSLTLGSVDVTTPSGAFSLGAGTTCQAGTVLAGGGVCEVEVLFAPGVPGVDTATLEASSDAGDISADLSGEGVVPELVATPPFVDYGDVVVDQPVTETITLSNADTSGATSISLESFGLSGADAGQFQVDDVTSTCQQAGGTVLTGSTTCTVDVTFDPTAVGSYSVFLSVITSALGSLDINLVGDAIAPTLGVAPGGGIDFGQVPADQTSNPETVTLSNSGTGSLAISDVTSPSAQSAFDEVGGTCPAGSFVLETGESCTIEYTFTPGSSAPSDNFLTTIVVYSNSSNSPDSYQLIGERI